MEIKGMVTAIMLPTSGTSQSGKDWFKQSFVIEFTEGNYTKKLQLDTMKAGFLNGISVGSNVDIKFNIESREYNGKYYTNANAWAITKI